MTASSTFNKDGPYYRRTFRKSDYAYWMCYETHDVWAYGSIMYWDEWNIREQRSSIIPHSWIFVW